VELHDHYLPALPAGDYRVEVTHRLLTGTGEDARPVGETFTAAQRLTVRGPQIAIDTTAVIARQPPANGRGRYAEVLPHLILGDPVLPWERPVRGASRDTPWLALLVLTDDQPAARPLGRSRDAWAASTRAASYAPDAAPSRPGAQPPWSELAGCSRCGCYRSNSMCSMSVSGLAPAGRRADRRPGSTSP
jgi:hypothetical protein